MDPTSTAHPTAISPRASSLADIAAYPMTTILLLLLVCGVLGGFAGYLLSPRDEDTKKKPASLFTSIVVGIVAAFTTPLLLNMISSDLLIQWREQQEKLFVIAGMALVAAVFGRQFLRTMYDRLMQRVEVLQREVQRRNNEPDIPSEDVSEDKLVKASITKQELAVMIKMADSRFPSRSLSGLRRDTRMNRTELKKELTNLVGKGFVEQHVNENRALRWYLSKAGCAVLATLANE